jgi:hypothetical protein
MTNSENDLFTAAIDWLRERLPESWKVELSPRVSQDGTEIDGILNVQSPNAAATVIVEARSRLGPRGAAQLVTGIAQRIRGLTNYQILVVSPWLSPKTREILVRHHLNFLDLSGNARIELEFPALFLATQGALKDPNPLPKGGVRLRGSKAGRLLRTLADYVPPYGVIQLAGATGLAQSYVSRVLDLLDDEAVIERNPRGGVSTVDVAGLIRRWVMTYDVMKSNERFMYLAPRGAQSAVNELKESSVRYAITGSFAAFRVTSVAVPTMLMAYVDDPEFVASQLGWVPAERGANVALLKPFDVVVWRDLTRDGELPYVSYSQVAADCLTGIGRMPQEGDALLEWMIENPSAWRRMALPANFQS